MSSRTRTLISVILSLINVALILTIGVAPLSVVFWIVFFLWASYDLAISLDEDGLL